MVKLIFVLVVIVTCLVDVGAASLDSQTIEIPFTFEKGYVVVSGVLNQRPVEMILATGAEHSTLDGTQIEKFKFSLGYTYDNPKKCNLADCTYSFASITNLSIGGLKPISLTMRLGTIDKIEKRIGRQVFGVLGADFFKGRIVQFDFGRKVVKFLTDAQPITAADKNSSNTQRIVLRMGYYDEYTILPIAEEMTFDGTKIKTILDTGAATVVNFSPAATKQLGQTLPAEKSVPRAGTVAALRLASYEMKDVPVFFYGKAMGFDRDANEFGAIAGTALLQNFITTFDFRNKVIILETL